MHSERLMAPQIRQQHLVFMNCLSSSQGKQEKLFGGGIRIGTKAESIGGITDLKVKVKGAHQVEEEEGRYLFIICGWVVYQNDSRSWSLMPPLSTHR